MDRRALLTGALAAGTAALVEGCTTMTASDASLFKRIDKPIGLQVYTLGDEAGADIDATFATVAGIGYREIELPGLYGKTARELRAAADRAGLAITSLHVPLETRGRPGLSFASPAAEISETVMTLGAANAVAPIALFPQGFRPAPGESIQAAIGRAFNAAGAEPWLRSAALINPVAVALKRLGVRVGYHNHNLEFAPIGDTTGWDILMREFDPAVELEVDIGWIAAAGFDPVAFLAGQRRRVSQLHVKDVGAGNRINYALAMTPAEVGSGTLDWARILPAARAAGVEHFYVEQEPPFTIPRIEAARKSYGYLAALRA